MVVGDETNSSSDFEDLLAPPREQYYEQMVITEARYWQAAGRNEQLEAANAELHQQLITTDLVTEEQAAENAALRVQLEEAQAALQGRMAEVAALVKQLQAADT